MLLRICACLLAAGSVVFAQAPRRTVSLVLTGGIVVTMDLSGRVLSPGAVAIDGRDIVAVDTPEAIAARFSGRESIDTSGQVVMPGLINTHTHAPMVLYRGLADDLALMDWLQKYIFPAEAKTVSPEFVRVGTRLAALEMIESGTTTFADMYYFEEEIAKATFEAGLRGVLGQTIIQFPVADAKTPAEALARAEAFIKKWKDDPLITPAVAPHALYRRSADAEGGRALANQYGVPLLIHLAETKDEIKIIQDAHQRRQRSISNRSVSGARARSPHTGSGSRRLTWPSWLARRRRGAQPRKQHEARERQRRQSSRHASRGRYRRARHRRRGQQQRPRHVRSHAPGGVPAQARDHATHGRCRRGRALELATVAGAAALGMGDRIGQPRARQAGRRD